MNFTGKHALYNIVETHAYHAIEPAMTGGKPQKHR